MVAVIGELTNLKWEGRGVCKGHVFLVQEAQRDMYLVAGGLPKRV